MVAPRQAALTALTTALVDGGRWIVVIPPAAQTAFATAPNNAVSHVTSPNDTTRAPFDTMSRAISGAIFGSSSCGRLNAVLAPQPQMGNWRGASTALSARRFCW